MTQGIHWTGETIANLPGHPVLTDGETLDQIVKDYFKKGYSYLEILESLKTYHGKTMSLSTRKRYFKSENIFVDLCTEGEGLMMKLKRLSVKKYEMVDQFSGIDGYGHT